MAESFLVVAKRIYFTRLQYDRFGRAARGPYFGNYSILVNLAQTLGLKHSFRIVLVKSSIHQKNKIIFKNIFYVVSRIVTQTSETLSMLS